MACVVAVVAFGMVGLAVDAGRVIIFHNELQTFVDASAVAAVAKLDGTAAGVTNARDMATGGPLGATTPNNWNFGTVRITNISTSFATSYSGSYDSYATASGSAANSYRFVKITAQITAPLYFLPVLPGIAVQQTLSASAVGGQMPQSAVTNGGLVPFAPIAHDPTDTKHFGFTPGVQYTLKWGNSDTTNCAGDAGFRPGNQPSQHDFVDLGQGSGNSSLRGVIEYGGYPNPNSTPSSVTVGTVLDGVSGNRGTSIFDATSNRSAQDPDQSSVTWADYSTAGVGNGRRVVIAPIQAASGQKSATIVGFGTFLLAPADQISGTSGALCATYVGVASLARGSSGGSDGTQVYAPVLYQ